MKRLGFESEEAMRAAIDVGNSELAPTIEFCGFERQAWFKGRKHDAARALKWQVLPRLSCSACTVPSVVAITVNSPESATALDFHSFLCAHYETVKMRRKSRSARRPGRPKDSASRAAKGGAE